MLTFDEGHLLAALQRVLPQYRPALAAAAAARLIGTYSKRHLLFEKGHPGELNAALQCVWHQLCSGRSSQDDLHGHLEIATRLAQPEGVPTALDAYADKAAASVVYVLRALLGSESRDVVTSVRCAYDATFQFAIRESGTRTILPGSLQALRDHSVVQQELQRQRRDLDWLCAANAVELPETIRHLKQTSAGEAAIPSGEQAEKTE